jgi:hypothetical protein
MAHFAWSPRRLIASLMLLAGIALAARPVAAYPLRSPQVIFNTASLQQELNRQDGGIQASTDQLEAQVLSTTFLGSTLIVQLLRPGGAEFGVYDPSQAGSPTRYPVFAAASDSSGFSTVHFTLDGRLVVAMFDSNAVFQGSMVFAWPGGANFGLYVAGPGGTWYSQDARNAGEPHALTYAGTGVNYYDLFECFEPRALDPTDPESFAGLVVSIERSTCGAGSRPSFGAYGTDCTPAVTSTWGRLKIVYRVR